MENTHRMIPPSMMFPPRDPSEGPEDEAIPPPAAWTTRAIMSSVKKIVESAKYEGRTGDEHRLQRLDTKSSKTYSALGRDDCTSRP